MKVFSTFSSFKRNTEIDTEDTMSTWSYFLRPDLNYYVMSPLVMIVTCKSRIGTNALLWFAGAHKGASAFALEHPKGQVSSYTQMCACTSQAHPNACNVNRPEPKTLACNLGCVKSLQTQQGDFLLCLSCFYCHCRVSPQFGMLVSLGV